MAFVHNFGCRLNALDAERMLDVAAEHGVAIVNSCAVTAEAERQARQLVRRLLRENPRASVAVTGCSVEVSGAFWRDLATQHERLEIIENGKKLEPTSWRNFPSTTARAKPHEASRAPQRASIEIQNGCNHQCTFCIIPIGRGRARSTLPEDVIAQIQRKIRAGFREFTLTGVDLTSWGEDLAGQPSLTLLLRSILKLDKVQRLRLSSLDGIELDAEFLKLFAQEQKLAPYLHLSLQSGDDMILKRMRRRHNRHQAEEICQALHACRGDAVLGADFITGFPTETETMFANTLSHVENCRLSKLHVFPYSERPGTPSARMPLVPRSTRRARAARLRALGARQWQLMLHSRLGQRDEVFVESPFLGRSSFYAHVRLARARAAGSMVGMRFGAVEGSMLVEAS